MKNWLNYVTIFLCICVIVGVYSLTGSKAESASADEFYVTEITDELFDRIYGKSFKTDCTVPREDLRYLHLLHVDLDGKTHEGEMIVNYHIADAVLDIFRELYEAK